MARNLSEIQAALLVRMSPRLLRWFTSYAPKGDGRKLPFVKLDDDSYEYSAVDLKKFDEFLRAPWPMSTGVRPTVPVGIAEEIRLEAACGCGFCEYMNDCEAAHIEAVAKSLNNHPHNLLWSCPNHHTQYDKGHRVHGTVKRSTVAAAKEVLLDSRMRRWRAEARAETAFMLLTSEAETMRAQLTNARAEPARSALERQASEVLSSLRAIVAGRQPAQATPASKRLQARVFAASGKTVVSVLEEVTKARRAYLKEIDEVDCPLCTGSGTKRGYESCPACGGEGTLESGQAERIDLSAYDFVDCPLCSGRGRVKGYDACPGCGGEGELPSHRAEALDVTAYSFVTCPLCNGKGHTKQHERCPPCGGEGELPQHAAEQVDVSAYDRVKCPLCRGKGHSRGYDTCPVCGGECWLSQGQAEDVELGDYAFVHCPPCSGAGEVDGETCRKCGGDGSIPKYVADSDDE